MKFIEISLTDSPPRPTWYSKKTERGLILRYFPEVTISVESLGFLCYPPLIPLPLYLGPSSPSFHFVSLSWAVEAEDTTRGGGEVETNKFHTDFKDWLYILFRTRGDKRVRGRFGVTWNQSQALEEWKGIKNVWIFYLEEVIQGKRKGI